MADKMARADLPLRGGQSTKNAPDTAAGAGGAQQHQAGVAHTGQGVLRGRETGSQPTGGDVAPTWAHHHHQGAWRWYRRRPERSVGWRCWLAGGQGTHPDSQSRSLARSRRRAGRSILRARWAAGTAHMPPRAGTTGTQRQHATWAAALLGRLPRLPAQHGSRRGRAAARPPHAERSIEVFSAG